MNIQNVEKKLDKIGQSEWYKTTKKYLPFCFTLFFLVNSPIRTLGIESVEYNATLMEQILSSPEGRAILLAAENQCKIEIVLDRLKNGTGKMRYFYYALLPFGFLVGFFVKKANHK